MKNRITKAGTEADSSTTVEDASVSQTIAKPRVSRSKTAVSLKVGKHLFLRYLMDYEYAEEMKCRCGFVIWACQNEQEAEKAVKELGGDVNYCG